jgi:Outer membrane protein
VGQVTDFELPRLALSAAQLKERAEQQRPQLRVLNSQINKSRASHRLARKELWPDFNLSVEYMFRQAAMTDPGYDMFTVGLTFNLPIQRERRAAMIAESNSEATMSTEEIHSLKNNIDYTINDSLSQLERRQRLVELYQGGIIPQAEQTLESSLINYRVGKVDFLSVLDSRVSLFNYERELYESKAEYMMQLARLEAAVGSDLTAQQK